jgi:hypothetical protein
MKLKLTLGDLFFWIFLTFLVTLGIASFIFSNTHTQCSYNNSIPQEPTWWNTSYNKRVEVTAENKGVGQDVLYIYYSDNNNPDIRFVSSNGIEMKPEELR